MKGRQAQNPAGSENECEQVVDKPASSSSGGHSRDIIVYIHLLGFLRCCARLGTLARLDHGVGVQQ